MSFHLRGSQSVISFGAQVGGGRGWAEGLKSPRPPWLPCFLSTIWSSLTHIFFCWSDLSHQSCAKIPSLSLSTFKWSTLLWPLLNIFCLHQWSPRLCASGVAKSLSKWNRKTAILPSYQSSIWSWFPAHTGYCFAVNPSRTRLPKYRKHITFLQFLKK